VGIAHSRGVWWALATPTILFNFDLNIDMNINYIGLIFDIYVGWALPTVGGFGGHCPPYNTIQF
jgi:hypothetical protein